MANKFLFDRFNFDNGAYSTDKKEARMLYEAEHQVEKYTLDQINKIKEEAHQKGVQEGLRQAVDSIEQKASVVINGLSQKMAEREAQEANLLDRLSKDSVKLILQTLDALYPSLDKAVNFTEIEAFLVQHLSELDKQKEITIYVHPDLKEKIESAVSQFKEKAGLRSQIHVGVKEDIHINDVVMDWGYGGAEKCFSQLKETIEKKMLDAVKMDKEDIIEKDIPPSPTEDSAVE